MDKIERMRDDVRCMKMDEESRGAMNLILDLMEEYRECNLFVQRLVNNYWLDSQK